VSYDRAKKGSKFFFGRVLVGSSQSRSCAKRLVQPALQPTGRRAREGGVELEDLLALLPAAELFC
ncbi:MAG: hypothetical protein MN733_25510, partial [Nitrososphaera sp.]|nr:hypothetical protein [Nitrososphaera sp.]